MRAIFSFCMVSIIVMSITQPLKAQDFENPGEYISYIGKLDQELAVKYLSYMSAASHGKSMKKVEKRRTDLLNSIYDVRMKVAGMPAYKADKTLRDASINYLKIMYSVFNEDYGKLLNMEEIAEQSYDLMEAYLLAQEKADEKLKEAALARTAIQKEFAKKHNVTIIDSHSELDTKLEQAGKVNEYYHQLYLIFFKSHKQEMYLLDALAGKNINAVEQSKNALIKYSDDGLKKLGELSRYNEDKSIEVVCRQVLQFFKDEAEKKVPVLSDFLIKTENFEQIKKAFDSKPASKRTQQDVDLYNKAVADMNKSVSTYNTTNQQLNTNRNNLINLYNKSVQDYMNNYMPYAR
jgi:hypothetical protein